MLVSNVSALVVLRCASDTNRALKAGVRNFETVIPVFLY